MEPAIYTVDPVLLYLGVLALLARSRRAGVWTPEYTAKTPSTCSETPGVSARDSAALFFRDRDLDTIVVVGA
ncbi:hypothetical protein GCM10027176_17850 [Actinoallomurus bryophytorum]